MKPSDFVHLHNHSTYSLLEGLPSVYEIVDRAKELKQTAVGLADKGYTYGLVEFYQAAEKAGLKPIVGLEAYVAARTRTDKETGVDTKRYPITLLAETQEGYQNLLCLATESALDGMYYKPRVDKELLTKYGKGLIALSGPIGGAIPQAALAEDRKKLEELVEEYRGFFGKDNLYFELMDLPNVSGQAEANQQLIAMGKELGVPCVVTCNSHYCRAEDAEAHDVLLCIQKNAQVADPGRFSMRDSDFSMRTFEELERAFSHIPEALENTRVIADRCNVSFQFGKYEIPRFPVPKGRTEEEELTRLCEEGFKWRYPDPPPEHHKRLEYELTVIKQVGFSGYFLIVADFVSEARRRGITVGPGRGSAAGSMVSYCLGVTGIDPIPHGLLFERFLNPERISMPDIDLDFADTRRDEVLEYVRDKYGADKVVQICTFGTLAARAAVKDVGRAYGVPFLEMNSLAKLIPERPGTKLKEALETDELKAVYESNEAYRKIIDTALKLEGKARHVSIHACGVIISERPAMEYTALQRAPKDENIIITQYSAKPLESLGLLKMDFLGLTNLTVIQTTLEIIQRLYARAINMDTLPLDDADTFKLLQRGDTTGVFQLESAGMRRYLKQLKPTQFEDITAMVSLYRPGPMDWIPSYIKRKHGQEKIEYLHDDLRPILEPTYGIGVYQEQVLQMAQTFAGFTLGEADILRRAIGKKIMKELKAQREKFISGAEKKGYKKKLAEQIFDDVITPFAGYGFNKSHAAGYARIAYETAYMKAHYPTEFMAALLSSDSQKTDRVMIEIEECRLMGIAVLPPDINQSLRHFTAIPREALTPRPPLPEGEGETNHAEVGSIRFGLSAIKGIGDSTVMQVITVREQGGVFTSLEDFAKRMPSRVLNKKLLEAMAKCGALDSLAERRTVIEHYEKIVEFSKAAGDAGSTQGDLFGSIGGSVEESAIEFPETTPANPIEKLKWEKEVLGMYVSSHPLAGLRKYVGKKAQLIANLSSKDAGKRFTLAGLEEGIKKITTKKGESMAILTLEDPTGKMEVTLFPRVYQQAASLLTEPDTVLVIAGTVDLRAGVLQMRAEAVKRASLSTMIKKAKEEGFFDEEEASQGLKLRARTEDEEETVDLLDEEGNVIAGEKVTLKEKEPGEDFLGPLGKWLILGMKVDDVLKAVELTSEKVSDVPEDTDVTDVRNVTSDTSATSATSVTSISIHTIPLPPRAPRQLLLDLKRVFETFPGKERIQLKIGEQMIPVPLTVSMSPILEAKIEEVISMYAEEVKK